MIMVIFNFSKTGWAIGLLVVAGLILANQFGGFVELGIWSIIIGALALVFLIQNLLSLNFAVLPIPIAALYWIFQIPLGLPEIGFWPLAVVAVLLSIALGALLPNKYLSKKKNWFGNVGPVYDRRGNRVDHDDGADVVIEDDCNEANGFIIGGKRKKVSERGCENNPSISVSFGSLTRYLHADALETVELNCNMGNLEVYFDDVTLSPNGAVVEASVSLGNIEIYLPREWRVIDELGASLGNAEVDDRFSDDEDAPTIVVRGNASLGNLEVNRIKRR